MNLQKATLIVNPAAGGGTERLIKRAYNLLVERGIDVRLFYTQYKGHAEQIAKTIVTIKNNDAHNKSVVIVAGGDGTYNEVANALVNTEIPMAILPMGTTSVLAYELNIPKGLEDAVEVIVNGRIVDINLGLIQCNSEGYAVERYFLLMAGIGFDGDAVKNVDINMKKTLGKIAYVFSGLNSFLFFKNPSINAQIKDYQFICGSPDTVGDGCAQISCTNLIVGNSRYYGGPFVITPDADIEEEGFYCFATKSPGRFSLLRTVYCILTSRHRRLAGTSYFKANELSLEGDASIQIDGDYIGSLPAKIKTVPKALRLVINK